MRKPKRAEGQPITETVVRLPDPTRIEAGKLAKSTRTRQRIMDAAVDCLAELGYANTSTGAVAAKANMTRMAMLYHFPSRIALIEAVIYYVMRKRNSMYYEAVKDMAPDRITRSNRIDRVWQQLQTNVFRAFTELMIASRTDPDLAAIFGPALAEYDRARRENALKTFGQDEIEAPWFDLRRDIVRFLLEGFAQQGGLSYNAERRKAQIMGFLKVLNSEEAGNTLLLAAIRRAERDEETKTASEPAASTPAATPRKTVKTATKKARRKPPTAG